jgi:hypothetical protein
MEWFGWLVAIVLVGGFFVAIDCLMRKAQQGGPEYRNNDNSPLGNYF